MHGLPAVFGRRDLAVDIPFQCLGLRLLRQFHVAKRHQVKGVGAAIVVRVDVAGMNRVLGLYPVEVGVEAELGVGGELGGVEPVPEA